MFQFPPRFKKYFHCQLLLILGYNDLIENFEKANGVYLTCPEWQTFDNSRIYSVVIIVKFLFVENILVALHELGKIKNYFSFNKCSITLNVIYFFFGFSPHTNYNMSFKNIVLSFRCSREYYALHQFECEHGNLTEECIPSVMQ